MKKFITVIICITLSAVMLTSTVSADWETRTYYVDENGNFKTGWQKIDGKDYFFKQNGEMITKSTVIDGIRYKFSSDGVCHGKYSGWTKSSVGYKYWENGILFKNKWISAENGKRYYAGDNGVIVVGWYKIENNWYHFDEYGVMSTGTVLLKKNEYTFSEKGIWDGNGKMDNVICEVKDKIEASAPKKAYGGLYNDGIIVVLAVDVPTMQNVVNDLYPDNEDFCFIECKYSDSELEAVKEILNTKRDEFNMNALVDTLTNCVILTVESMTDEISSFIDTIENKECIKVMLRGTNDMDD